MNLRRVMIAAPKSGSGKTTITCGLLKALQEDGNTVVSYKCGPDYIDPMFHQKVLGIPSKNLDSFFTDEETTKALFLRDRTEQDFAVMEGVMGLYDGLGGIREEGSSYHLAKITQTPILLVVDAKGMGRSLIPLIAGFLSYDTEKLIQGVILNRISGHYYDILKPRIEEELHISVAGYVSESRDFQIQSRHLGLHMPEEIGNLQTMIAKFAEKLKKTIRLENIVEIATHAVPLHTPEDTKPKTEAETEPKTEAKLESKTEAEREPKTEAKLDPKTEAETEPKTEAKLDPKIEVETEPKTEAKLEPKTEAETKPKTEAAAEPKTEVKLETKTESKIEAETEPKKERKIETKTEPEVEPKSEQSLGQDKKHPWNASIQQIGCQKMQPVIAVARDAAFCFYYEDNLNLLKEFGAKIVYFSPLYDTMLPEGTNGILLGGGYPEFYCRQLSENTAMHQSIRSAVHQGIPLVAECGGFLYLHEQMEDLEHQTYPMVGIVQGGCHYTGKLVRFGYIELQEEQSSFLPPGQKIRGHEFHYYDSESNGTGCKAVKPAMGTTYSCVVSTDTLWLGFPHLYYPSNPEFAGRFVSKTVRTM